MKRLLMILTLAAFTSCGGDNNNSDNIDDIQNDQTPQEERVNDFSTRIDNKLLIAGRKCAGNETTTDATGANVTCQKDQWLITLDNANTCTPGGACTEIGVFPFVAELDRSDRVELPRFSYFQIDPLSAVTPAQENTIDDYLVKFDLLKEEAEVVPK